MHNGVEHLLASLTQQKTCLHVILREDEIYPDKR